MEREKILKKAIAVFVTALLMVQTVLAGADGNQLKDSFNYGESTQIDFSNEMEYPYYAAVLEEYRNQGYNFSPSQELSVSPEEIQGNGQISNVENKQAYIFDKACETITYPVTVSESAVYELAVEYYFLSDSGSKGKRSLLIDGETPYFEADGLEFTRLWKDEAEPIVNSAGDEVKPRQVEIKRWQTASLEDAHGFYSHPLTIYLEAGTHEITFLYVAEDMAFGSLYLKKPEQTTAYQQPSPAGQVTPITFEAEQAVLEKTDSTLRREPNTDPATSPSDPQYRKLNIIGDVAWSRANQKITWEFYVDTPGNYTINMRALQMWLNGIPSYRMIEIDGQVPCEELLSYQFEYDTKGQAITLETADGEPMEFYFDEGKHTLSMTVKLGPLAEFLQDINEDSLVMSNIMLEIMRLTGSNPDPNYDYEFYESIPTLEEDLRYISARLQEKYDFLVELCEGDVPGFANSIIATKKQLDELIEDPFSIARNMSVLTNIQTSLGSWYSEYQSQPLSVDYFTLQSAEDDFSIRQSSFWEKAYYMFVSLVVSFTKDYDRIDSSAAINAQRSIDVWIARGTEWATLIKELADTDWTPESGVRVNINVMPASQLNAGAVNALMLSIISGKSPDVAMGVDPNSPVEFAIREAVLDLKQLDGFEEISKRFISECLVPFQYNGGIYALPETMDFRVMFYRTDIIEKLGLRIPQTRQEIYENVLPVLYQNGMNFYYPRDDTQFIFQNGGSFYTEDGLRSALDTPEAYAGLKEETELYTSYGIPVTASFYNRFRSGEMPMGIGSFNDYMSIMVAAPELSGKVAIAPLPGIEKENGEIDRSVGNITGQSTIILSSCQQVDDAWDFVSWWTSDETQTTFGREIEALVGLSARWNSANIHAFESMAWDPDDLEVIQEMWNHYREVPVVLGGYFTSRYLTNAWNSTVISGQNLRDCLEDAVFEINRELETKQEEYGVKGRDE